MHNSPKLETGHQEQDGQINYKIHSEILFSSENEWNNSIYNEWVSEWMNEWINEWASEWMSGWMNE